MSSNITLSEAIQAIRTELQKSAIAGQGECIRFVPKTVDIELTIAFSRDTEASGGFKLLSLIDLAGKEKIGHANSHKVKITLEPASADGSGVLINDKP